MPFPPMSADGNDGRHLSHTAVSGKISEACPNHHVNQSQPRSQPPNLDSLLNDGSPIIHYKSNQSTPAGVVAISEAHHLSSGIFGGSNGLQEHTIGQSPNQSSSSSEGLENIEPPANYDFSQHGAIVKQQDAVDNLKMWQKQYFYQEQLQELQPQQPFQQLDMYSRHQQQLQLLMPSRKQCSSDPFPPWLYGSSLHELSNFVQASIPVQQMEVMSYSSPLLPGTEKHFNASILNWVTNGSPAGCLMPPDPSLASQILPLDGTHLDSSVYYPAVSNVEDAALQPLDLHPSSQEKIIEIPGPLNEALATASQLRKPLACDSGLGESLVGNHQANYFDTSFPEDNVSCARQQVPIKHLTGQTFHHNLSQTPETSLLLSNWQQGNFLCANLQEQDFAENQQKNWAEDALQKDELQFAYSHCLVSSDASSQTMFCDSRQTGCHSVNAGHTVASSDSRTNSLNEGKSVHQGGFQDGCIQVLNNLAHKQHGSWSALMQSALAEISSFEAGPCDDLNPVLLQKIPFESAGTLQLLHNEKQITRDEHSIKVPGSFRGSSFLANHANAMAEIYGVPCLPQTSLESTGQLGSRFECNQFNNQSKLQLDNTCQSFHELALQVSRRDDQSSHQVVSLESFDLQDYADFEEMHQSFWKPVVTEHLPSKENVPSKYTNLDGRQHNHSWNYCQRYSETKHSQRMLNLTSNEQGYQEKNDLQEIKRNNVWLNSIQGCQKHQKEDARCSKNDHLENHQQKIEELNPRSCYTDNDNGLSVQLQVKNDAKYKAYEDGQSLQQEESCMKVFTHNSGADNLENIMQMHHLMPENDPELFSTKLAIIQNNSERHQQMPESSCQMVDNNSTQHSNANIEGIENSVFQQQNSSHVWNSSSKNSIDSDQETICDLGATQHGNNNDQIADEVVGQVGSKQQNAKAENNTLSGNGENVNVLQSIVDVNQREQTPWSWKNTGLVDHYGNESTNMASANALRDPLNAVLSDQLHADKAEHNSYLEGLSDLDLQRQGQFKQIDIGEPNMAGHFSANDFKNTRMLYKDIIFSLQDIPNIKLQDELKEMLETGCVKEILSGCTSTNNSSNISSLIRTVSSLSASANLSNVVPLNDYKSLNGIGCTEQDDSDKQLRSSPSDVSPPHFFQIQLSGTLSSQGHSSVPASPSKQSCFLQYGRPLHLNSFPHARQELDIQETSITGEPEEFASEASAIHQNSLLKASESDKNIVVTRGSPTTSLVQPTSSCCLVSFTDPQENVMDVKQDATHTIASDMHKLEAQVCELNDISTRQQQTSLPRIMETHISFANEAGDVANVSSVSEVVNSEKEPGIQSIHSLSSRSSCEFLSPANKLKENGLSMNCQFTPGSHHLTNEMNGDQCLQESQASSMSSHSGESAITNLASFSKLLSTIKKLANQQRRSMGVGMTFPCVFESFRSSICQMEKYAQSLPSTSDSHLPFGKLSTTENLMTSRCPESYGPCTVNIHQLAPTEELTMQGPLFQQGISEKVVANGFPMSPSLSKALPLQINNIPPQEFGSSPSIALQGQAHETCLMPKISSSLLHSVVHPFNQEWVKALQMMLKQNNEANKAVTSGPSLKIKTNQQVHSHNCPGQTKVADTSSPAQWQAFSVEDAKILPLSSCPQESKGKSEEVPIRGFIGSMPIELQKQDYNHITNEPLWSSIGVNDKNSNIPHLPKAVVSQLGTVVNDKLLALQVAATYQRMVSSGISPAIASQQNFPRKNIQCLFQGAALVPVNTSSVTEVAFKESELRVSEQISKFESFSSNKNECIQQNSSSVANVGPLVTVLPKKRKRVMMPLLPWHIKITEPGGGIPTISASELAWAAVTNRLVEKDESDDIFDEKAGSTSQAKRRLKLISQLTQQLVPPLPSAMMCGKRIVELESLIYTLAKIVLANACKLGYKLGACGDYRKFKRLRSNYVQRVEESYMGRVKDLENELQRLNASSSMSELRSDSQDLDRLLITNRLAKHHVRSFTVGSKKTIKDGKESSSDCGLSIRKMCPHRYVTAIPMPKDIPEGLLCYSL